MVIVQSYAVAVAMCVVTMMCWGSWANTQKLATKKWPFQLYYWDYCLGVVILSLIMAFTLGSMGSTGRGFVADISQVSQRALMMAFLGGVVFNLANILLVAAIDIAGMSVAFPIGIGIALVEGVIINYAADKQGNPVILFAGVAAIMAAIVIDAIAYRKLPSQGTKTTGKGIVISVVAGVLMGLFFRLVQEAMPKDFAVSEAGKVGPYAAVVIFSVGLFLSSFIWNTLVMRKPFVGEPVKYSDYAKLGDMRLHIIGILGGMIWGVGMSFANIASGAAGDAISYGLGQGATLVAAIWGVFIWKEFKGAPKGTNKLLGLMFACFFVGLALIILAKNV
ncbi:MAG: multidrug DMT transporter permease [Phycisphaeraceae bacterium]|nr:multidrug DMT transporter permease [Phycisphaeraceae bacterium]